MACYAIEAFLLKSYIISQINNDHRQLLRRNQTDPDSKVHGANVGPTWVLSAPDGPHVCPMNLATREVVCTVNIIKSVYIVNAIGGVRSVVTTNPWPSFSRYSEGSWLLSCKRRGPVLATQRTNGTFYSHGLSLIPAWICNHMLSKVWDEITLSIPKLQRIHRWSLGMDK